MGPTLRYPVVNVPVLFGVGVVCRDARVPEYEATEPLRTTEPLRGRRSASLTVETLSELVSVGFAAAAVACCFAIQAMHRHARW
jgi:hypothetical protein